MSPEVVVSVRDTHRPGPGVSLFTASWLLAGYYLNPIGHFLLRDENFFQVTSRLVSAEEQVQLVRSWL